MKCSHYPHKLLWPLLFMLTQGCAIDVGNPHPGTGTAPTTPSTALLSMSLTDSPIDTAKHVYLNLQSITALLLGASGTTASFVQVPLAAPGPIDVLALKDGKTANLFSSQALPSGDYTSMVLGLSSTNPASIVDQNNVEYPLDLSATANRILLNQPFNLSDNQSFNLLMNLDLQRSIIVSNANGTTSFQFSPYANLNVFGEQGQINGTVVGDAKISQVCAYLFQQSTTVSTLTFPITQSIGNQTTLQPVSSMTTGTGAGTATATGVATAIATGSTTTGISTATTTSGVTGSTTVIAVPATVAGQAVPLPSSVVLVGQAIPVPNAITAVLPPSFASGQTFTPSSDTSTCANAFTIGQVTQGSFILDSLWPGQYQLIFYHSDGSIASTVSQAPVDISAGQVATLTIQGSGT